MPCAAKIPSTGTPMCSGASTTVFTCGPSSWMIRTTPAGTPRRRSSTTKNRLCDSYGPYSSAISAALLPKVSSKTWHSRLRPTSASGSSGPATMDTKRPRALGCAATASVLIRPVSAAVRRYPAVRTAQNSFATMSVVLKYLSVNSSTVRGSKALQV
jgi:hypothetical protein